MVSQVSESGFPGSLNNCVLTLDESGGYLRFLQHSSSVESKGLVSSYQYNHHDGQTKAEVNVVPIGGSLAKGFCTIRHHLELLGEPITTDSEVRYRLRDTASMEPCSTAQRQILSPVLVAKATTATLACPRAEEPWYRRPDNR